ncbi:secretory phospholipase A2 receptor-like isoform X2 [Paramisgurnus dabryanus]|uniref:secretory phospholipase A2 receptor-like isoform X2 n=1 Tax=Paramisgurnus dabryanus TaxID=90735 RepID=UPI003CCF4ADC
MERMTLLISVLLTVLSFSACYPRQYHFVNRSMTWDDAQRYCRANHTDLATVNNTKDLQEILKSVKNETEFVWIGLHKTERVTWKWTLGDPTIYSTNDLQNQPVCKKENNPDCVFMNKDGSWDCEECNKKLFFICYNDSSKGFILEGINKEMTWREAQRYCREEHTDLASVKNEGDKNEIKSLMNNLTGDQKAWIGLFRDSWEWSDNSTSSFRNWDTDKPDKECTKVKVRTQKGNWTDEDCDKSLPFVCHDGQ